MRVAIAGAGAVGRSIAGELLENGHEVLLIDKAPTAISVERVPAGGVAARRRLRDHVAGRGGAPALQRGDRGHRRRQGQPGRLAAREDRVRRPARGRPGQQPQERVAVQRVLGRGRRRLHAAPDVGPGRGGGERRRPGPAAALQPRRRQPGRADAAAGVGPGRHPGRRRGVAARTPPWSRSSAAPGSSPRPARTPWRRATSCCSWPRRPARSSWRTCCRSAASDTRLAD